MARPLKPSLLYFPLDTDMNQDDKIALIEAKHGIVGFGVLIKLFKKIYGSNGYFYDWNEETGLLFSRSTGTDFNKVNEIVNDCVKWKLFDETLYKKYKILTSKRIQKTYLEATYRRKEIEIIKEYLVNPVIDSINRDNVRIFSLNDSNNKQRKRKGKRKGKGKGKERYADTVTMLEEDYRKLIEKYGEENTKKMITVLDNYKDSKGKTYTNDYKAILSWVVDKVIKQKRDWRTT